MTALGYRLFIYLPISDYLAIYLLSIYLSRAIYLPYLRDCPPAPFPRSDRQKKGVVEAILVLSSCFLLTVLPLLKCTDSPDRQSHRRSRKGPDV